MLVTTEQLVAIMFPLFCIWSAFNSIMLLSVAIRVGLLIRRMERVETRK